MLGENCQGGAKGIRDCRGLRMYWGGVLQRTAFILQPVMQFFHAAIKRCPSGQRKVARGDWVCAPQTQSITRRVFHGQ